MIRTDNFLIKSTDCNTIWLLPNEKASPSWGSDDGLSMLVPYVPNSTVSEGVLSAQQNLNKFWIVSKLQFVEFWTAMRHQSRENFVRTVHPTIVQSLRDRYCVKEGTRIYEDRYNRELMLAPKMTIEGLISGTYLIQLIEILVNLESLQTYSNKMVLELRRLNRYKKFPLTGVEILQRDKEVPPISGQTFVVQGGSSFGIKISISDGDILDQIATEEYNLYKLGKLSFAYEFDIVSSTVYFIYTLIGRLVDEFRAKILSESNTSSILDIKAVCGYCANQGKVGTALKQCRQCMSVYYCST